MKHQDDELDLVLDRAVQEIREDVPDRQFEQAATDRVWQNLSREIVPEDESGPSAGHIRSCEDFQTLIPDYVADQLPQARHLLLQDHLGECIPCRRALKERRGAAARPFATPRPVKTGSWFVTMGWRAAAAAVIFMTLIGFGWKGEAFSFESGGMIRIEAVEGELFQLTGDGNVPLKTGDVITLEKGEGILTAKGSSAILTLADDSQVEMRERSELAVLERNYLFPGRQSDGQIDLKRGSVIVEASDQGSGHLYVNTSDCRVAVTGTVFSVSHGMRGSRVSVIEGEVHVNYRGNDDVLLPGQQTTTRSSLAHVPVAQDVAWSRNSAEYLELLREMRALGHEIDDVLQPGLRYDTDLLDLVPATTVVYVAMPNISDELGQAYEILQGRMAASDVLREWWEQQVIGMGGGEHLEEIIEKMRTFGDHLDEEVVMTVQLSANGEVSGPLFLARVSRPEAFLTMLAEEVAELEETYEQDLDLVMLQGQLPVGGSPGDAELYAWVRDDILALTPNFDSLWVMDAALQRVDGSTLAGSAFHEQLRDLYEDGVEWAVGVDLQRLIGTDHGDRESLEQMGLLDVQHVIAERKQRDGRTENRAVLTFDQPRRRMASWLAEPAAMGALDYVGPDASLAAAFVMKDMDILVDELFDFLGKTCGDFEESIREFQSREGVDIRRDFAAPLGGEFAIALDGPVLPTPSWKLVLEVYDPARFQRTMEWLVDRVNQEIAITGQSQGFRFESEQIGRREFFSIESLDTGLEVHFVFDGGYVIAGPSRGLLDRTLQNRSLGIRLTDSANFMSLLPRDDQVDFSGMIYQNLGPVLGPLAGTLSAIDLGDMVAGDKQMIASLAEGTKPSLAVFYGLEDRIIMASSAEGGLFTSGLDSLSGVTGLLGMQQSLARLVESEANAH
jgi:hypothetical protein